MTAGGFGSHPTAAALAKRWPFLEKLISVLYPPMPVLNTIPHETLQRIRAALFPKGAKVLNIGAGTAQGAGARLWRGVESSGTYVIQLDVDWGPDITLIADAMRLPLAEASVDSVVLQAVLEHVAEPDAVISEAARVLKPGGFIYVEMPFLQGFHADPHDYQRYTVEGLRCRLAAFRETAAGVSAGPFCALVWLLRDLASSWTTNPLLFAALRFVAGWGLAPLRYLDFLVRSNRVALRLASEVYLLAQKPGASPDG